MSLCMVYATFPDKKTAHSICNELVKQKLIACANLFPQGESIYEWQGEVKSETEVYALFKTTLKNRHQLEHTYVQLHPYETPCLVFFANPDALPDFLKWVVAQTL